MVKAFVSNVDSPFGHNVSRLLTSTIVGSRKPEEEPEEDEDENEDKPKPEAPPKEPYVVVGTMLPPRASANRVVSEPGPMVETGNRKKDNARREAIEKYAVVGRKPKWVSDTLMACFKLF